VRNNGDDLGTRLLDIGPDDTDNDDKELVED
jgi:hypothetical protein